MSQCEKLWAQYVPISGAVDPVCPNVRNDGPSIPHCEELWTQYVPWRGEMSIYLSQLVLLACQRVGTGQHNVATADCCLTVSINHRTCGKSVLDRTRRSCAQLLLHFSLRSSRSQRRSRCTTCVCHVKLCDFLCHCDQTRHNMPATFRGTPKY